jgi:hypothetical protein
MIRHPALLSLQLAIIAHFCKKEMLTDINPKLPMTFGHSV